MARTEFPPISAGPSRGTAGRGIGPDRFGHAPHAEPAAIHSLLRIDGSVTGSRRIMPAGNRRAAKIKPNEIAQAGSPVAFFTVRSLIAVTKQLVG